MKRYCFTSDSPPTRSRHTRWQQISLTKACDLMNVEGTIAHIHNFDSNTMNNASFLLDLMILVIGLATAFLAVAVA